MDVWRVNVRTQELKREPVPAAWQRLGGRGLSARILLDEVDPRCDPLGPDNKLIFAPGLLVGHMLSSTDRISVGGKSPLTGGIKESNAGGRTGLHMTHMGIHALILEDQPKEPGFWVLHLSLQGAKWEKADDLAGLGVYEAAGRLVQKHRGTVLLATPTFLRSYLRRCEPEEFTSLDVIVAGAEKLPAELCDEFEAKFGKRPIEGYGTTELSPLVSVPTARVPRARLLPDR